MQRRIRTAVGNREKGTWKAQSCEFPLVSDNYESPKELNSPHLRPKFTFRAAVLVQESPLYPVPRHEKVHMKRSVEELVALYETGFKLRKSVSSSSSSAASPPPSLKPPPQSTPFLSPSQRDRSPSISRLDDSTRKRMSIVIPPPTIKITEYQGGPAGAQKSPEEQQSTPEDSPILVSLSRRIPAVRKMLHPGQYPGRIQTSPVPERLPAPNDIFGKVTQALLGRSHPPSPTLEIQPPPPIPLIQASPAVHEIPSSIDSHEERPSIPAPQPLPVSVPRQASIVDIPRTSILSKSSSAASLRRPLKPQERAETVLTLSREAMIIPKVQVPQLPAFRSRRAKAGWKQTPDLTIQGENKGLRVVKNLSIFGNEALNRTMPEESRQPEIVLLGAKEEPLERMMAESFSAKKLPPHRLAVDFNLYKGVRRVARLRLQMRKLRQQLMVV